VIPPDLHSGRGDPLPHSTPSAAVGRARRKRPGVGTPNLVTLNLSAVVAHLHRGSASGPGWGTFVPQAPSDLLPRDKFLAMPLVSVSSASVDAR